MATPGRLSDLVRRGACRLEQVAVTVLDEADQMTDMGFMPQVTELLDQVHPGGQRLLFSATLDRNVDLLVRRYLTDPVVVSTDPAAGAVSTMEHHVLHVQGFDKHATTIEIGARNVGVARAVGVRELLRRGASWVATTDADTLVPPGWLSNADFLSGYGAAQAVPGPLFTFSAFLGFERSPERSPLRPDFGFIIASTSQFWRRLFADLLFGSVGCIAVAPASSSVVCNCGIAIDGDGDVRRGDLLIGCHVLQFR